MLRTNLIPKEFFFEKQGPKLFLLDIYGICVAIPHIHHTPKWESCFFYRVRGLFTVLRSRFPGSWSGYCQLSAVYGLVLIRYLGFCLVCMPVCIVLYVSCQCIWSV